MANDRQQSITIDSTKVTADVTYMPVLLTRDHFDDEVVDPSGGNAARTDGGDIRLYQNSNQTSELAREIVAFEHDSVTAAGDAAIEIHTSGSGWVISSTADTTIYTEYGDGALTDYAVTDTYGRNNVWGSAEVAVLMEDATPVDHTGNHTLTTGGTLTNIAGPFGRANSFSGTTDKVSTTGAAIRDILTTYDTTLSVISRRSAYTSTGEPAVAWDGTDDFLLYPFDTNLGNGLRVFWRDLGGNIVNLNSEALANTWVYTSFTTRASNDHEAYTNGSSVATAADTGTVGPFSTFEIGSWTTSQDFNGDVAQVVVYKAAKTDGWITTEYNNQSAPATFATAGTPTGIGGGSTFTPRMSLLGVG